MLYLASDGSLPHDRRDASGRRRHVRLTRFLPALVAPAPWPTGRPPAARGAGETGVRPAGPGSRAGLQRGQVRRQRHVQQRRERRPIKARPARIIRPSQPKPRQSARGSRTQRSPMKPAQRHPVARSPASHVEVAQRHGRDEREGDGGGHPRPAYPAAARKMYSPACNSVGTRQSLRAVVQVRGAKRGQQHRLGRGENQDAREIPRRPRAVSMQVTSSPTSNGGCHWREPPGDEPADPCRQRPVAPIGDARKGPGVTVSLGRTRVYSSASTPRVSMSRSVARGPAIRTAPPTRSRRPSPGLGRRAGDTRAPGPCSCARAGTGPPSAPARARSPRRPRAATPPAVPEPPSPPGTC